MSPLRGGGGCAVFLGAEGFGGAKARHQHAAFKRIRESAVDAGGGGAGLGLPERSGWLIFRLIAALVENGRGTSNLSEMEMAFACDPG